MLEQEYFGRTLAPGAALQFPEGMVQFYTDLLKSLVEDGKVSEERKAVCEKAIEARVININEVLYDGAEPKWDARVPGGENSTDREGRED